MRDRDFLIWIHGRLELHCERPTLDYMHKLRAIIKAADPDKVTPNRNTGNSLAELMEDLGIDSIEGM